MNVPIYADEHVSRAVIRGLRQHTSAGAIIQGLMPVYQLLHY